MYNISGKEHVRSLETIGRTSLSLRRDSRLTKVEKHPGKENKLFTYYCIKWFSTGAFKQKKQIVPIFKCKITEIVKVWGGLRMMKWKKDKNFKKRRPFWSTRPLNLFSEIFPLCKLGTVSRKTYMVNAWLETSPHEPFFCSCHYFGWEILTDLCTWL